MNDAGLSDEADAEECCCPGTVSPQAQHAAQVLFCAGRLHPALKHLAAITRAARDVLKTFTDSTVVYVLAKMNADLISIYLFRLHERPFCCPAQPQACDLAVCGTEANSLEQFVYTLGLLIACTPLRWLSRVYAGRLPSLQHVPAMLSQCVGWSLGAASSQLLRQLDRQDSIAGCVSCNLLNLSAAALTTVASAVLIVLLDPPMSRLAMSPEPQALPTRRLESMRERAAPLLQAAWALLRDGLKYNQMIVWTYALTHVVEWGVPAAALSSALFGRTLVLFALSLTTVLSLLAVGVLRWRQWLDRLPLPDPPPECAEWPLETSAGAARGGGGGGSGSGSGGGGGGAGGGSGESRGGCTGAGAGTTAKATSVQASRLAGPLPDDGAWLCNTLWAMEKRVLRRAALAQTLVLLEATMGWVTGSAWTDAVVFWSPLGMSPTPSVILKDVLIAVGLTILMCTLPTTAGRPSPPPNAGRPSPPLVAPPTAHPPPAFSTLHRYGWLVCVGSPGTAVVSARRSGPQDRYRRLLPGATGPRSHISAVRLPWLAGSTSSVTSSPTRAPSSSDGRGSPCCATSRRRPRGRSTRRCMTTPTPPTSRSPPRRSP